MRGKTIRIFAVVSSPDAVRRRKSGRPPRSCRVSVLTGLLGTFLCVAGAASSQQQAPLPPSPKAPLPQPHDAMRPRALQPTVPASQQPAPMPPRAIPPTPPEVHEAQRQLDDCVSANRPAHELWRASNNVVATLHRRNELKKTGERRGWKLSSVENFQRSEHELAGHFARYKTLGSAARSAEDVVRGHEPCREAQTKLDTAVREA